MTLELLVLPSAWGLRNASAFNLKAEALLSVSGLDFTKVEALPSRGPKGKLPALVDGDRCIGDSSLIQAHLESVYEIDFDGGLSSEQRADAEAYRRMAEEHLYFVNLHIRWMLFPAITRDAFFGAIPAPIRGLVFGKLRRTVKRTLWGQGLSRHTTDEILAFGIEDVRAIAQKLRERPFLLGDRATSVDAAVYPQILNTAAVPYDTSLRTFCRAQDNLMAYCERCEEAFFS
ncbi:MAG: glutathione S-transferase family protein [Myxococcota bacterium]